MATSVPVPTARPRSACASAGESFTPSPAIATVRPSAWRPRITSAFCDGITSRGHGVDAGLGGHRARGRLVVASEQNRLEAELAERGDGLG